MGKTYSTEKRNEEVIIAQNGANDATHSHFEQQMEKYGTSISIVVMVIILAIIYIVYKKCIQRVRKVVRQEVAAGRSDNYPHHQQQALPRQMV